MRNPLAIGTALAATVLLEGCVMQSTYNKMLVQQHSIEAALR